MARKDDERKPAQISQIIYSEDGRRTEGAAAPGTLLTKDQILSHIAEGDIIIDPYCEKNVGGASVDVRLGQWFYRENRFSQNGPLGGYVSLRAKDAAQQLWLGPFKARTFGNFLDALAITPSPALLEQSGIGLTDSVIVLAPGENILGHTEEFIGGNKTICTAMHARSSLGRSHLTVCRCAGWGDPGYFNRWTMEITNNSKENPLILVAGMRVAQIVFWEVQPVEAGYGQTGKYQAGEDLIKVKASWTPQNMLPKLYLDWDVNRVFEMIVDQTERHSEAVHTQYAIEPVPHRLEERDLGLFWENGGRPSWSALMAGIRFKSFGILPFRFESIAKAISQESAIYSSASS